MRRRISSSIRTFLLCLLPLVLLAPSASGAKKKKPTAGATAKKKKAPAVVETTESPLEAPPPEEPPAPEPPPPPPPKKAEDEEPPPPPPPPEGGPPAFDLSLGLGLMHRDLSFSGIGSDDTHAPIQNYSLPIGFVPSLSGTWYPGAHVTSGVGGNIGIAGYFEYPLGLKSNYKTENSTVTWGTSAYEFMIGVRGRIPSDKLEFVLGFDYGMQSFEVQKPEDQPLPNTKYAFVRPSFSGRYAITDGIALMATVAFRYVLNAGEITTAQYFSSDKTTVWGFDLGAGAAFSFAPKLEARIIADIRRYQFTMNGLSFDYDPYVVSGASDTYLGLKAQVAFRY